MRWDDVGVLLAVARAGTLTGAASALGVDTSTALRRLDALEAALGQSLVERSPRGARLTEAGEALIPFAERMEEDALALLRTALGHDRRAEGPVRITLPTDLLALVAPLLSDFRAEHPGVVPELWADGRAYDLGREADVALRASRQLPEGAVGRKVAELSWAVYRSVDARDDAAWVAYGGPLAGLGAEAWRASQAGPVAMRASSVGAVHAILGCVGLRGLLPCYLGEPDRRLVRQSAPVEAASGALWLLVHADLRRSARVRAVVDFLAPRLGAAVAAAEGGLWR